MVINLFKRINIPSWVKNKGCKYGEYFWKNVGIVVKKETEDNRWIMKCCYNHGKYN